MTSWAKASVVNGVCSGGFRTTVLPQAKAGAILWTVIISGKFQGVIAVNNGVWVKKNERTKKKKGNRQIQTSKLSQAIRLPTTNNAYRLNSSV